MHSVSEFGAGVPAFLAKLWKLVEDPTTDDLISWSPNGKSFCIRNQGQFAKDLLPHYYKHNNMASFVRQLNMYGFHKKVSVEIGGLRSDKDEMEFVHQYFCKGQPGLMDQIKRKITSSKTQLSPIIKQELMNKMLLEVKYMKGRQEHLDTRIGAMRNENEAVWRELAILRQKHMKQQQIVNKLIHFLLALVHQPSRGGGLPVKRSYPLMLNDSNRVRKKACKLLKSDKSPKGPVIHELDASEPDLNSEYMVSEMLEIKASAAQNPENIIESIDDDNMENINSENPIKLKNDIMANSQIDTRKKAVEKSVCTNKTKRKKMVPVKISIPSLTNGEKPREELYMLDMPDEAPTIAFLNNDSVNSKAVPIATVRSSKLAAMAANIKKSQDTEYDIDLDTSVDLEDDTSDNDTAVMMKLEDILIVPHIIDDGNIQNVEDKENDDSGSNRIKGFNQIDGSKNILKGNSNESYDSSITSREEKDKDYNMASTSSKDLSLSCVNPSDVSEDNYRLAPTKEMDNHVETMQTDLVNLRELLSEGYNLNNNTLYELFNEVDALPLELLKDDKEDVSRKISDSINGFTSGELMAYNPSPSIFEFDDVLLNNASSSLLTLETPDFSANTVDASDPLDLEDSKTLFLDCLATKDANSKS